MNTNQFKHLLSLLDYNGKITTTEIGCITIITYQAVEGEARVTLAMETEKLKELCNTQLNN